MNEHEDLPRVQSMQVINKENVMKVALGAGIALVLTDQKALGAILLALAGACAVSETIQKNDKRPEKKNTRPQKDPIEDKTPKGAKRWSGTSPHKQEHHRQSSKRFWGSEDESVRLGRRSPGLQAIRAERKSVGSDGESSAAGGTSTKARARSTVESTIDDGALRGQSVQVNVRSGQNE